MDFIGIHVLHKAFGRGIITAQHDTNVDVEFSEKMQRKSTFQFPGAFLVSTPFLIAEDEPLVSYIDRIIAKQCTCVFCYKRMDTPKMLNSGRLCSDCQKIARPCYECHKLTDSSTPIYKEYELCDECFNKTYFKCSICGEIYEKDDMLTIGTFVPEGEVWCHDCANEKGFHACEECDEYFPDSELTDVEDYYSFCPACLPKRTKTCSECGERYLDRQQEGTEKMCSECARKKSYLDIISNMDFSSLKVERIHAYTLENSRTVSLMTKLHTTKKSSDEATQYGVKRDYSDVLLVEVSDSALVIVYGDPFPTGKVPPHFASATMTEFKKGSTAYHLAWKEHELLTTLPWSDDTLFELWKSPFKLRAQTDYDKDYRKEWHSGDLVYEGNNYGDTSSFWIIGNLKKKK